MSLNGRVSNELKKTFYWNTNIIVSGPNMVKRSKNWNKIVKRQDIDLLTVPLKIWRELVAILKALLSAGILIIYWIKSINIKFIETHIIGFDLNDSSEVYHYADDNHKAGLRHNWKKEKELLSDWIDEYNNLIF